SCISILHFRFCILHFALFSPLTPEYTGEGSKTARFPLTGARIRTRRAPRTPFIGRQISRISLLAGAFPLGTMFALAYLVCGPQKRNAASGDDHSRSALQRAVLGGVRWSVLPRNLLPST